MNAIIRHRIGVRKHRLEERLKKNNFPYDFSWPMLRGTDAFEVGRHLVQGLKNPTVVRDTKAREVFPIRQMSIREAMEKALASTTE